MKLFGRKKGTDLMAFTSGTIIPLEKVNDEMFSAGLMGPGIAIDSIDGKFYSPVNGKITMLFPTKHALGIKTSDGQEILLHIGVDTVSLKGEGFTAHVTDGQEIAKGDLLLEADLDFIKKQGMATEAILCISEPKDVNVTFTLESTVNAKKDVLATINR